VSQVRVGCCGFARGMKNYFERFHLVEVQQTFYKVPRLETATKWREQAPVDFEFTLKASQVITHPATSPTYRRAELKIPSGREENYGLFKPTDEVLQAWEATREFARTLRSKVIVFQCPASFRENSENIKNFRSFFKSAGGGFLFAWEPRGEWKESTVKRLCAELGLIHCVDPFEREPLHGEVLYFRLHGGPGYRHRYTRDELNHLANRVSDRDSYVLFNNLSMYEDAQAFMQVLACRV
jgi:uncharacterized protein YecE (DUF72 family)